MLDPKTYRKALEDGIKAGDFPMPTTAPDDSCKEDYTFISTDGQTTFILSTGIVRSNTGTPIRFQCYCIKKQSFKTTRMNKVFASYEDARHWMSTYWN